MNSNDLRDHSDNGLLQLSELSLANSYNITNTISNDPVIRRLYENQVSHYLNIDKHITRLPQFQDSKEFLSCLAQLTSTETNNFSEINLDALTGSSNYKYEVILENQRGAMVFGIPLFSTESLLYPLDPSKYQTLKGNQITRLDLYPLPGINWRWSWPTWYVLMINDVDEQGWIYSHFRFGSKRWKGRGGFGNFVRRRIWIRMREIDVKHESAKKEEHDSPSDEVPSELFLNTSGTISQNNKLHEPSKEKKQKIRQKKSFKIKNMKRMKRILTPRLSQKNKTEVKEKTVAEIPVINLIPDQNVSGPSDTKLNTVHPQEEQHTQFLDEMFSLKNGLESSQSTVYHDDLTSSHLSKDFLLDVVDKFQSIVDKLLSLPIDRLRVKFLIESCLAMSDEELSFLTDDTPVYPNNDLISMSSYSNRFIHQFLNAFKFSQSKRIFITKLGQEVEKVKIHSSLDHKDSHLLQVQLLNALVQMFEDAYNDS